MAEVAAEIAYLNYHSGQKLSDSLLNLLGIVYSRVKTE